MQGFLISYLFTKGNESMHSLLEALINLIFPTPLGCKLCGGKSDGDVCSKCQEWLAAWAERPKCRICGRTITSERSSKCRECHGHRPSFSAARAAGPYEEGLREAIHLLKFKGRKSLVPVLAKLMVQVIQQQPSLQNCQAVIPVPLSRGRLRQRGFNQAELLASEVARGINLPMLSNVLVKHKETPPQTGLTKEQRKINLQDAFKVKAPGEIKGKNILLLDDVFTTGSTVSTIAQLLRQEGVQEIFVITLANAGK